MGLGRYLTKECCASLRMRTTAAKQLRSFPEAKEKDPKATRKKKECTKTNSAPSRLPCAHGPRRPSAHGLHRELALEHPVRTGLYRAHGTPMRTGPTYPVRMGPTGWTVVIAVWASSSSTSSLTSSHLYISYLDHLLGIEKYSKVYEMIM